ncbi:MAG: type IV pilin [Halobacteriales archaeon]
MGDGRRPNRVRGGQRKRDAGRGVTPVVATVLLVAVVVALAGAVAAGFLNFTPPAEPSQASASLTWGPGDDGEVRVTYVSRGDAERLEVRYEVLTTPADNSVSVVNGSTTLDEPGDSMTLRENAGNVDSEIRLRITVVAVEPSGGESVVTEATKTI